VTATTPALQDANEGAPLAATSAARILIVEDDFAIASNLHAFLSLKGFDVDAAYSGQAALHRCSVERFVVIARGDFHASCTIGPRFATRRDVASLHER
jgi:hypothetical protein